MVDDKDRGITDLVLRSVVPQNSEGVTVLRDTDERIDLVFRDENVLGQMYATGLSVTGRGHHKPETYFVHQGLVPYVFNDELRVVLSRGLQRPVQFNFFVGKLDENKSLLSYLQNQDGSPRKHGRPGRIHTRVRKDGLPYMNFMVVGDSLAIVEAPKTSDDRYVSVLYSEQDVKKLKKKGNIHIGLVNNFVPIDNYNDVPAHSMYDPTEITGHELVIADPFAWIDVMVNLPIPEFRDYEFERAQWDDQKQKRDRGWRQFNESFRDLDPDLFWKHAPGYMTAEELSTYSTDNQQG
ncbi:hypothetical protein ACFL0W_06085 [Nanoarchaeota archaeon]